MLSVVVRVGEALALLVVAGILVLAAAAAFAWWLRRRLRRLVADHARAVLARAGLPACAEVIARRPLALASWRRALAGVASYGRPGVAPRPDRVGPRPGRLLAGCEVTGCPGR
jgi:hypothetical protein